ncbi:hypothetical protein JHK87_050595 [Glycine soja]|nr:hypothetical protein JHK87_050595 [Glycine soja]
MKAITTTLEGKPGQAVPRWIEPKLDGGKVIGVEPAATCTPSPKTAFVRGVSSSVLNSLPSLVRVKLADNRCEITKSASPG